MSDAQVLTTALLAARYFGGNEYALLKLAYLYLQQASAVNRLQAHELARYGELLLSVAHPKKGPSPHDADHRRAGYHIVASVYLWNVDREAATRPRLLPG